MRIQTRILTFGVTAALAAGALTGISPPVWAGQTIDIGGYVLTFDDERLVGPRPSVSQALSCGLRGYSWVNRTGTQIRRVAAVSRFPDGAFDVEQLEVGGSATNTNGPVGASGTGVFSVCWLGGKSGGVAQTEFTLVPAEPRQQIDYANVNSGNLASPPYITTWDQDGPPVKLTVPIVWEPYREPPVVSVVPQSCATAPPNTDPATCDGPPSLRLFDLSSWASGGSSNDGFQVSLRTAKGRKIPIAQRVDHTALTDPYKGDTYILPSAARFRPGKYVVNVVNPGEGKTLCLALFPWVCRSFDATGYGAYSFRWTGSRVVDVVKLAGR